MIGKISGIIKEINGNIALIETNSGLSFEVFLTPELIKENSINNKIEIYTYLQVREDAFTLFGFSNKEEYYLFKMLLAVDGIGPKSAYSIISFATHQKILEAVNQNNIDFFCEIPGIGRKTAQKILLELSSKLKKEFVLPRQSLSQEETTIIEALNSLGFKKFQALKILDQLPKEISLEEKIKLAIKLLTKNEK